MAKLNDLTGKTFGYWKVLRRNGSTPNKASKWRCICTLCGKEYDVVGASLTSGYSTKCRSCVPTQTLTLPNRKTRLYHIYTAMKQRCTNPNAKHYSQYGGRGISVCEEWINSPDAFMEWAISNGYNDSLTIDRINNDKGYCPDNCRWTTPLAQARNKRNNICIIYNGVKYKTLLEACAKFGINYDAVRRFRSKHGCDYQTAFEHFVL